MQQVQDADFRALRIFVTIVRSGGFSAAQSVLNISQSTLSEHMSRLEARLDVRLCERGRGGFRLTEQGREAHAAALRLLSSVEDFRQQVGGLSGTLAGELRIGVIDNTITNPDCPLPAAIRRFNGRDNEVRLQLEIGAPQELEQRVLDGRLHAAIGVFPGRAPGLLHQPLFEELHRLYCGRGHPLLGIEQPDAAQIDAARVVARSYLHGADLRMLGVAQAAALVDNMEAQALLILTGGYLGFLPEHYAARWLASGELWMLRAADCVHRSRYELISHAASTPSRVLALFLDDVLAESARLQSGSAAGSSIST